MKSNFSSLQFGITLRRGRPSQNQCFVFNGNYIGRGSWSLEVLLVLLAWKILMPESVFLLRGSSETRVSAEELEFNDPSFFNCDAALQKVFGEEKLKFTMVSQKISQHLSPPPPIHLSGYHVVWEHTMTSLKPGKQSNKKSISKRKIYVRPSIV